MNDAYLDQVYAYIYRDEQGTHTLRSVLAGRTLEEVRLPHHTWPDGPKDQVCPCSICVEIRGAPK